MENFSLIINKEKNYTSRDVVNKLNKILNTKKIGHTGTLDPIATGVLVCLVGKYTKLVPYLMSEEKEYEATIKLGIKTDTLDITGNILEEKEPRKLSKKEITQVLNSMIGEYNQTVPLYSAKQVNGKRLYAYARAHEEVELPQNKVFIKEINLISYQNNIIKFSCVVSKGTYIRSLIDTICTKLNVLGTMSELIRTRQGKFTIQKAVSIEDISLGNFTKLKITDLLKVKVEEIDNRWRNKIYNGNKLELKEEGLVLFKEKDQEIALYNFRAGQGRLVILLI